MGEKLDASFDKATGTLKKGFEPQRGGTCGLYCIWYASLLLSTFTQGRPIVWPKRSEAPAGQQSTFESMRHFAKTVGSGQGEIVNLQEMSSIITQFGYQFSYVIDASDDGRKRFINESLAAERPILFPYLEGGTPGQDCRPIGRKDDNCGAHWSLLYSRTEKQYLTLDPHWPDTPRHCLESEMLKANTAVDNVPEPQEYLKSTVYRVRSGEPDKTYQVMNRPGRIQQLSGLLVAIH